MQIDFHHGVTYCVARLAGFKPESASIIAHSAQYVDDATSSGLIKFDNDALFQRISSAHKKLDYRNFEELANHRVWIPFHFLPGNQGSPASQAPTQDFTQRLICYPDSYVARDMVADCIRRQNRPYALHRLGVVMHVYVDTWAHQGFAGINHPINRASDLIDAEGNPDLVHRERIKKFFAENIINRITGMLIGDVFPLGHGSVLSYPDKPFLKWGYTNGLNEKVVRDNPTDFLQAAEQMCRWFQRFLAHDPQAVVPGLPLADRDLIAETLANTTEWKGEIRHQKWLDLIRAGKFSFGAEEIDYIGSGAGSWRAQALGTTAEGERTPYHYQPDFLSSNWKLFHDALLAHRFYIIHELLPQYGICVA
jgi:hypothetical protein